MHISLKRDTFQSFLVLNRKRLWKKRGLEGGKTSFTLPVTQKGRRTTLNSFCFTGINGNEFTYL